VRFLRDTVERVVVMRRCLVVANQTLQAAELRDELRERIGAGPCSFFVIVPATKAAQYDPVAAGGVLPQPGMWWWATYYARPATDEEATAQARERLSVMLDGLAQHVSRWLRSDLPHQAERRFGLPVTTIITSY
jgi:hypothetical protein